MTWLCCVVVVGVLVGVAAMPIVDPGLFVIQGVSSCINGTGYCMLGNNCTIDVDFKPDTTDGHCRGLRDAFTPKIDFVCCQYNPLGKATSEPPTTTLSPYTITDIFSLIDEQHQQQQQQQSADTTESYNEFPTDYVESAVAQGEDQSTSAAEDFTTTTTDQVPEDVTTSTLLDSITTTQTSTTQPPPPPPPPPPSSSVPVDASNADAIIFPQVSSGDKSPTGVETQPLEEVTENMVMEGEDNTHVLEAATETQVSDDTNNSDAIVLPQESSVEKPPSGVETQALEEVTETLVPSGDASGSDGDITLSEVESNSVQNTHEGEASTVSSTEEPTVGQVFDQSVGETVSSHGIMVVGELPEEGGAEEKIPGAVATGEEESGVVGLDGDFPGGEPTDYDYYSNYPDQLLLQPVNQNICGFKGLKNYAPEPSSSRILGGLVASTVEWCWVAAIMERRQGGDKYVCSGALVESNLIVSTATCLKRLESRDLSRYVVVLGDSNLRVDLPYGLQFHSLAEVVTHPDYFTSGGAHAYDIGVVRLVDHATLSHNVCLVCMAQQDAIFPAQTCTITGYGIGHVPHNMVTDVRNVVPSDGVLRQLSVPLLKKGECRTALQNITGSTILASSDSFLCAGGLDHAAACYSTMDGGSPLACEAGGRWFVAGLVSWSKDCTVPKTPTVYTRMSSFTSWIQATYLRMLGFLTHNVYSNKQRWMQQHLHDINKQFA